MKKVITRFAPSPTGYIHIGNLRASIYPYLLAKQTNGTYILRIEDTDRARYVDGATELIMETLRWIGINWDEGPDVGGPNAPYFQTERTDSYYKWAQKLADAGLAYADPRTPEEMEEFRKDAAAKKVPFLARNYRPENPPKWEIGIPLRLKQTELKPVEWDDAIYGKMSAGPEVLDDIILIKRDGLPTYNFGHIVDDAEMGITHVFRGQEYLSSMPNYLTLYKAMGVERPVFVHMPHILRPDGRKKLGKRDGAKSASDYRADGILPEAMLNFLASLGWNDGTEQEIYSMEEMIRAFSLDRVQRSGARFDEQKLLWMNGQWLRRLSLDDLYTRSEGFWPTSAEKASEADKKRVLVLMQDRLKVLADLRTMTDYFFEEPAVDLNMIFENKFLKKISKEELKEILVKTVATLDKTTWKADELQASLNELLAQTGKKPAELFSLIRISITFTPFSPALNKTMAVLGKDTTLERLRKVIEML